MSVHISLSLSCKALAREDSGFLMSRAKTFLKDENKLKAMQVVLGSPVKISLLRSSKIQ